MTSLSLDLFWRDRGVQRGLKDVAQQADKAHTSFDRFSSSASRGVEKFGNRASKTFSKVAKASVVMGAAVTAAAGVGLVKAFGSSVDKAAKFQSSMRLVGVTTGETGNKLKTLTALAQKMGAETSFSAQGASDAMLALAKGGMTSAEIKAGALKQTLTLATAGGLELGRAADFMVQGLNSFGLKANQSSRVATALAGAANASTASVDSMGQALSQVGAQAKVAGLSLEDTTAALAAFDNAGVKGSDAGTSLKTFLQRLVPSTASASKEMKKLGLITSDGANRFFDAKGKILDVATVSQRLQDALKGQTKEQKIATLTTIFGSDASRAAAILADQGAKGLAKYTKATNDKNAAERLAKSATEGFSGALERFKGSVETAQIQFGTKLLPSLTKGLDLLSGRFLPAMVSLGQAIGPVAASFGRIAVAVGKTFIGALTGGRDSFKSFADYISTHQADIIGSLVNGGKAALGLGRTIATMASSSLRALGTLSDASVGMTTIMLAGFSALAHGAAETWGWIPGLGPKLRAADKSFAAFAKGAVAGMKGIGPNARAAADAIDRNVVPAIDAAQGSLDKIGKTEIAKARLRDSAAKAAQAIQNIGTKADGSQIKIKHFNDITRLSSNEQTALRKRLNDAKGALRDQLGAMSAAGAGQKSLTRAWEVGRDRLYKEFRQMGLSKEEARKLAKQYAGVPPKVQTKVTAPGLGGTRRDVRDLDNKINALNDKTVNINFRSRAGNFTLAADGSGRTIRVKDPGLAEGGTVPGWSPHPKADNIRAWLTAGEEVIPVGPAKKHRALLKDISAGRYADGGTVGRNITVGTGRIPQTAMRFPGEAMTTAGHLANAIGRMLGNQLKAVLGGGGGLGDPAHVANPRGITTYHGARFTRLFVANLRAAERDAGRSFQIYQGGFRPTTSYSGSTHNMDAIDARVNYALLRAFRRHVGAMGDRTGLGNWASHMHGVPAPGHGYGSPSARAQYRDYLRRGGARQGMRSPWGLSGGGVMLDPSTINVSERGPERVLTTQQNVGFERLVQAAVTAMGGSNAHPRTLQIEGDLVMRDGRAYITGIAVDAIKADKRREAVAR